MANLGYVSSFNINGNELSLKDAALTEIVEEIIEAIGANNGDISDRINNLHERSFDALIKISSQNESEIANIQDGMYKLQYVTVTGEGDNAVETLNDSAILIQKGTNQYLYKDGQISSRTKENSTWGSWITFEGGVTSVNGQTGAVTITETQLSKGTATGVGNAVTDITVSNHEITLVKGATYATQSDIDTSIAALVDSAPETLNTLNELAAALGDDPNFATTVTTQIGQKYTKPSTGIPASDLADGVIPDVPVTSVNGQTGAVTIDTGVTSFNGATGAITYTAPVTSVNGQTGAVTIDHPVTSVNGATGAVVTSLSSNYASATGVNEALQLASGDTYEQAFGKLEKAIVDNEEVVANSLQNLNNTVNNLQIPQNTSDLNNDSNYLASGDNISELNNNAGYLTLNDLSSAPAYGITSADITNWNTAYTNNHTHSNKSVLDDISSSDITNWNNKLDSAPVISVNGATGAVVTALSSNYATATGANSDLFLAANDTYETAFGKLEKAILDNESVTVDAFVQVDESINSLYDNINYIYDNIPVTSVNGQTGAVTIDTGVTSFNGATGAITYTAPVTSVNGMTGAVVIPEGGVTSFNGATGAITYTAPVTSVNGATGTVVTSLSSNYASATGVNEALQLASGDTYEQAFGKLEKAIIDNEEVVANSLQNLNSTVLGINNTVNNLQIPQNTSDLYNDTGYVTLTDLSDVPAYGISASDITNWNTAYTNNHTHSNKSVLDGISSSDITNWNNKLSSAPVTSVNGETGSVSLALGDTNIIETIKVNNTALTPVSKAVNITVPTKVSDLTNDSNFTSNVGTITGITMNGVSKGTNGVVDLGTVLTEHQDISGKVDKVTGMGLSSNDYTTTEKNKLAGINIGSLDSLTTTELNSIFS